jgi:hypothetical protein
VRRCDWVGTLIVQGRDVWDAFNHLSGGRVVTPFLSCPKSSFERSLDSCISSYLCFRVLFIPDSPLFLSFSKLGLKQHCNSSLSVNFLTIDDATIYKFVSVAVLWVQCLPWRTRTRTTRPRHNRIAYLCGKLISCIPSKTRNQRVLLPSTALRSSSTLAISICARWIADLC